MFLDPPYALATDAGGGNSASVAKERTAAEALFVVERATRDPFEWPEGVEALRHKKYGETTVWYGR